jgi:two-component system, cell cycle sensor histidine kinase and response regulator CckA
MAETLHEAAVPAALPSAPIRVLLVEHDGDDIELCLRELKRDGLTVDARIAATRDEFAAAARDSAFDVILADFRLPNWTGIDVLNLARELGLDAPLILVTGTLGEELAVDCIKRGINDYVLKHQLARLGLAIRRSLEEKALREGQARAQKGLHESEIHYRSLVENAPEAIVVFDAESGTFVDVNHRAELLFGCSRDVLFGHKPGDLSPASQPDGRSSTVAAREYIQRALQGETLHFEWTHRNVKGEDIPCEVFLSPIPLGSRRLVRGSIVDITERKRAEAALRDSEARYRSLFESAIYGVYRTTLEGEILDVNPSLVAMLGFDSVDEVLALRRTENFFRDPVERHRLAAQLERDGKVDAIVDWVRKDGRMIKVRVAAHRVQESKSSVYRNQIVVEDVTEHMALEKQLRQAQKFEAFGQLAGGIAHDFNNMIGAILGWAELGLDETRLEDTLHTRFEKIRLQADRAASLTRQLLTFARRQALEPRHINLNQAITETLSLLEKIIGSNIHIRRDFAPDLAMVRADPAQIEQVLMNLCLNARDAMPAGGELRVATSNVEFDADFCRQNSQSQVHPGRHVLLSVSDNGEGMDAATLDRIFEPFFTTKGPSKGTGLGLATVYGVAKQHGGLISVDSQLGKGTCFRFYLPVVEGAAEAIKQPETAVPARGGTETILVAEDHEGLRQLALETLTTLGYKVLCVTDGEAAVELYGEQRDAIALAILDIMLPKLTGPEAHARMRAQDGGPPVIFVTGYSADAEIEQKLRASAYSILHKPFSPRELGRRVRELLDQTQAHLTRQQSG